MSLGRTLHAVWAAGWVSAVLSALLGAGLLLVQIVPALTHWSYDWPFVLRGYLPVDEVVLVYMDEISHDELKQPSVAAWDRAVHGRLVNRLRTCGAKAIVFDIVFQGPDKNPAGDAALAEAIRAHGKVVLGAKRDYIEHDGATEIKPIKPYEPLRVAATNWGLVEFSKDSDRAVRRHFHGTADLPSLAWQTARLLGSDITSRSDGQEDERWLNYYQPPGSLPHVSYYKVLDESDAATAQRVRDKVVFVGPANQLGYSGGLMEYCRTPYTWVKRSFSPGTDIHAMMLLNLIRGDWLTRLPPYAELAVILLCGLGFGLSLSMLRPGPASLAALGGALLVATVAVLLFWLCHTWFAWLIVCAVQIPAAWVGVLVSHAQRSASAKPGELTQEFIPATAAAAAPPFVPDHELLRCIGRGSYGEVWLARNVTGAFRAVKVVHRHSLGSDRYFEREFAGLKRFEPISRSHPGLVNILHVGRHAAAGYFYYVMELADDAKAAQASRLSQPDETRGGPKSVPSPTNATAPSGTDEPRVPLSPGTYIPKTLHRDARLSPRLPINECLQIGLSLTSALEFLHQHGLIHRDIKPSNIIFVSGLPKLADIGLVAAVEEAKSFVGTVGYIPPEGPGTASADLYSLGKVLYEVCTGLDSDQCPELPGELEALPGHDQLLGLLEVVSKACASEPSKRYSSAQAMHTDLLRLLGGPGMVK